MFRKVRVSKAVYQRSMPGQTTDGSGLREILDDIPRNARDVARKLAPNDRLIEPALVSKSFAMTHAPKYLVMLNGAGHFAFTELSQKYQATIAAYAIGFFDNSLSAKPAPLLERPARGQVARFEHRP